MKPLTAAVALLTVAVLGVGGLVIVTRHNEQIRRTHCAELWNDDDG